MDTASNLMVDVGLVMVGAHPWLADLAATQLAASPAERADDTCWIEWVVLALGLGYIVSGLLI